MNLSVDISQYLWTTVLFVVIYLAIRVGILILKELLGKLNVRWQVSVFEKLEKVLLLFLVVLFILTCFVRQPWPTLALFGVMYLLFKKHIHDYLLGIHLRLNDKIGADTLIQINQEQGIVQKLGFFGLTLNTDHGVEYINYSALHPNGYTIIHSSNISTTYTIMIDREGMKDESKVEAVILRSPLVSNGDKVKIRLKQDSIVCKVKLRNDDHFGDFCKYITDHQFKIKETDGLF